MTCQACRQALSARLDGEEDAAERTAVDEHLASCTECRSWFDDAAAITRLARTVLAGPPSPGVDTSVLHAAPGPWRARVARALRWVLGALGLAQFLLGVAQISALAGQVHSHPGQVASAGHLWHESAAWNLAIGAGFGWIAARRGRPSGVLPILTVFVTVLALLSLADLAAGRVTGAWLLSHAVILAGYAVIVLLSRPAFDFGDPPTGRWAGGLAARWSFRFDDIGDRGARLASRTRPAANPYARRTEAARRLGRDEAA